MEILLFIHGLLRWPILLVLAAGLIRSVLAFSKPPTDRLSPPDRILASVLVGALDTQVVLGLVLLFFSDAWTSHRGHVAAMVLALLAAHVLLALGKRRPRKVLTLALFVLPAILILWGLALL